jgi:CHAT domain-containing protein/tetratricopeptide (TPR) repeat protein
LGIVGGILVGGLQSSSAQDREEARRQRAEALVARAESLRANNRTAPALAAYRRAQGLYRELGADTTEARVTGAIGILHYLRDRNDAALRAFREAAATARAAGAAAYEARLLNNMGVIERRLGRFDSAAVHIRRSLAFHRARADSERVAKALNNLANIEEERGRFDQAAAHYREALSIARALNLEDDVPSYLNNLGLVLRSQGRYEEALQHHRAALQKHRALDTTRGEGAALSNIGAVQEAQGRYAESQRTYQKRLDLARRHQDRAGIASALHSLGTIHRHRAQYETALTVLRRAMMINRDTGARSGLADNLREMATVYRERGEHLVALRHYRRALRIDRGTGRLEAAAATLYGMGVTHLAREQYATADSLLQMSIAATDTLLQTTNGTDRRHFLAQEMDRFHTLVTTRVRAGRPEAALRVYEQSRARLLAEQLQAATRDSTRTVPPVDSLQAALGPDEAAVLYANTDTRRPVVAFVVTRTAVRARELSTMAVLERAGRRYAAALDELRAREARPWQQTRPSLLREAKGVRVRGNGPSVASLVRLYRHELSVGRPERVLSVERRQTLGQYLHSALVAPVEASLSADELVIVPDGALSYLPFEALSDWSGTRVVERRRVRYVQSLRVQYLLRRRAQGRRADRPEPLLALGGVVYDPATYVADTAGVAGDKSLLATRADAPSDGSSPSPAASDSAALRASQEGTTASRAPYQALGYGPERWSNLVGTLTEVRQLRRLAGGGTLLVGAQASEYRIRRMSATGRLDDYRALHFATHGFVVASEPLLSALVLSEAGQDRLSPLAETNRTMQPDGYLNMREIAALDLTAEFVGLSACQTGLGRIYRGSGAVSLTHAFLEAGATSVAVSLWSVNDASSQRFMTAVYGRAWRKDISWSEALAQTKRAFAAGHHGTRFQSPRYWAPFVYYGWEGTGAPR